MKQSLQQVLEKYLFEVISEHTYTWLILDVSHWLYENGYDFKIEQSKLIVNTFILTLNPEYEEIISTFRNF